MRRNYAVLVAVVTLLVVTLGFVALGTRTSRPSLPPRRLAARRRHAAARRSRTRAARRSAPTAARWSPPAAATSRWRRSR
ncbi:MAG TPA: hypothetical protein VF486_00030 [Actinomycetes bacterium]